MKDSAPCHEPSLLLAWLFPNSCVTVDDEKMMTNFVAPCAVKLENCNRKGRGEGEAKRQQWVSVCGTGQGT